MKKILIAGFAFILLIAVFQACNEPLMDEPVTDELELKSANSGAKSYIVVLNDSELNDELSKLKGYEKKQEAVKAVSSKILNRAGIADGEVEHVYGTAIQGFSVKIAPGQLKKLQDDPSVKRIEEDQIVTLIEPKGKPSGGVTSEGEITPWGITRVGGGTVSYNGSGRAWIIDTGIDLENSDLNVNTILGVSFVRGVTSPDDDNGHGSHVSGTVAAKIDGKGVVGVAPGAVVIPVKVLDKRGSGWTSGVIAGVDYVAAQASGDDAANMSLGGGVSASLDNAVFAASLVCRFALAAGNEKDDANNHSPARVNNEGRIFTVSAMSQGDNWASFSNYGNPPVDFCAPGVGVTSYNNVGTLETWNGTSMATPHVTGILLLQSSPGTNGYVSGDPDGDPDPIAHVGNVTLPDNRPPVSNAGSDQTVTDSDGNGSEDVSLNGSGSSDPDGDNLTYSWTENNVEIATGINPSHPFSVGMHNVTLIVSDGEFTDTDVVIVKVLEYTPTSIDLNASTEKIRGTRFVTLNWSGASGDYVVVKANGSVISTTSNDGSETIDMGKSSGTFVFEVCETDGSTCSNPVTLVL